MAHVYAFFMLIFMMQFIVQAMAKYASSQGIREVQSMHNLSLQGNDAGGDVA